MPTVPQRIRTIAISLSLIVLVSSIVQLSIDTALGLRGASARAERMRLAESAALEDPAASAALQAEVEMQTADSMARSARQRIAAIVAMVAGACCLTLLKQRRAEAVRLPAHVAAAVDRRTAMGHSLAQRDDLPTPPPVVDSPVVELAAVEQCVDRIGRERHHLIPLLHALNEHYHYLPPAALRRLGELTEMDDAQISGVASFYAQFRTRPRGKHLVQVCRGTACHVSGADRIHAEVRRLLAIPAERDTDANGEATVETVGCLGCCTLAPVLRVDGSIEGHTNIDSLQDSFVWENAEKLASETHGNGLPHTLPDGATNDGRPVSTRRPWGHRWRLTGLKRQAAVPPAEIRVGLGSCCVAGGSREVFGKLQGEIAARRLHATLTPVGCVGICHLTPLVEVAIPGGETLVATRVSPQDIPGIIQALPATMRRSVWNWPVLTARRHHTPARHFPESPCQLCPRGDTRLRTFTDPQVRIVTEHSGMLDPTSLGQYRAHGGFSAWERCLRELQPNSILTTIEQSGLRGRGGAGYPTALKWRKLSEADGRDKYLVCNGDEGDPGAFMDRMIMESYPYRVLEGMAIAAYAVGAERAYLYVRHEYPLAVERLRHALERMAEAGLLGSRILGTAFSLQVELMEGAGAFVCGEETALLQSIMGHRGTPQLRPPYPVERGLFDRPTLVNNVETFANVPWILRHGAERFAALGTATSKGTKVFSLAGKVRRGGLIEIPLGLTIRDVVERIGGGVAEGKQFKSVQIGGPSGGCVPAELADTPIDYEHLQQVGAILGSGGLVVLDNDDCMVDVARYFLEFTQKESCGHCTFCRVGTRKLLDILERICAGKGKPQDLDEIESLGQAVQLGSLCGLGKTAPNPVLSTLKYFREEYEAHLRGRCPAGRCKSLIRYEVTVDCVGCTLCAQHCPVGAIAATPYRQHVIDGALCTRCDACRVHCPEHAIQVV